MRSDLWNLKRRYTYCLWLKILGGELWCCTSTDCFSLGFPQINQAGVSQLWCLYSVLALPKICTAPHYSHAHASPLRFLQSLYFQLLSFMFKLIFFIIITYNAYNPSELDRFLESIPSHQSFNPLLKTFFIISSTASTSLKLISVNLSCILNQTSNQSTHSLIALTFPL